MSVTTPCYCSRVDAQRAIDFKDSLVTTAQADRAIQSASRNIEGHLHRLFYPWDGTKWFDWPNYQYAYPWRLWLDRHDILCLTAFSSGSVNIPLNTCFFRPQTPKPGFPFTWIELDRSTSSVFGGNSATPQNAIQVTGTWNFTAEADQAGTATLAASITSSTSPVTVTDSSQASAGDLLIIGYGRGTAPYPSDTLGHAGLIAPYIGERVLVNDVAMADTSTAQSGSGCSTASNSDNALQWTGAGNPVAAGEVIQLDSEQMLVQSVTNSVATVTRAWNGTVLATHSSAEIYANRSLLVTRGYAGTAAAAASSGTAVYKHRVPPLVRDLAIAEAVNQVLQETSGYSRTVGAGEMAMPASGIALADLWDEAETEYGRKARVRVI